MKLQEFLVESNAIEGEYDIESLWCAKEAWDFLQTKKTLTAAAILEMHDILMENHLKRPNRGSWRRRPVYIGYREGLNWNRIPMAIDDWLFHANISSDELAIKRDHVKYEHIHPFIDGNGRSGRIIMNWQRVKHGFKIETIKEKDKLEYYAWFNDGDPS